MRSMVPEAEKSRVLIVEDDRPLLSYLSALLTREYEVFTAESTADEEGIIRDRNVQVVLCDHDMPGEKGLDFLSRMRQAQPKTQRILLTGHAETEVFLKAINEPKTEWESPLNAFEEAYQHECAISGMINRLVDLSIAESDHAANSFLQWFVNEQVEEEAAVDAIVEKLKLVGDNGVALFMLDGELGKRTAESGDAEE